MTLLAGAQQAPQKSEKNPVSSVRVTVLVKDTTGAPVPGAGVVLKQASIDTGRMSKDPFQVELHTDSKGNVTVQGFAPGVVLVQVIAHGFQTYGQAFIMEHADETVHVKLDPPRRQISIYK
ncbi:MAG TPA: carboxypeptidase-like regulatory domain-containing protein [Terriglobales bacterium]|nr:carboxypeptidase-like regulatory domain-containing protein [Terriglobales bacterium]